MSRVGDRRPAFRLGGADNEIKTQNENYKSGKKSRNPSPARNFFETK